MSARLTRSAVASLRATARPRTNYARRNMSAQSHGAQPKKSDMPWVIGTSLVFGPLFLYLVSPSARKSQSQHAVHNDLHDFPALAKEASSSQAHPKEGAKLPEIMKDDEGTPADVTATVALSEASDVPKISQPPEVVAETTIVAEQAPVGDEAAKEKETVIPKEVAEESAKGTVPVPEATPSVLASTEAPPANEQTQA